MFKVSSDGDSQVLEGDIEVDMVGCIEIFTQNLQSYL